MLALSTMSPDAQAVLYTLAFLALAVAAVVAYTQRAVVLTLIGLGAALFVLVAAWDSLAAT